MKSPKNTLVLSALTTILAFSTMGCEPDTSLSNEAPASRDDCSMLNPNIGATGMFSDLQHDVGGQATIVSDCEVMIENFTFDGGGLDVRIYADADEGSINSSSLNLSPEDLKDFGATGGPNFRDTFSVFIPEGTFFAGDPSNTSPTPENTIDALSVWCVPAEQNFGSMTFN